MNRGGGDAVHKLTPETECLACGSATLVVLPCLPADGDIETAGDPLESLGAGRPADSVRDGAGLADCTFRCSAAVDVLLFKY